MNSTVKLGLALVSCFPIAVACNENKTTSPTPDKPVIEKAGDALKGAAGTAKGKFEEMKSAFSKSTDGQMSDFGKQIDDLKEKAKSVSADRKADLDALMKKIGDKKDDVVKTFNDLKSSGEGSTFEGLKNKLQGGINDLKTMINDALAKLKS